jgi:hypothetical protein
MVKGQKDISIEAARMSYGFTLNEIADYLGKGLGSNLQNTFANYGNWV